MRRLGLIALISLAACALTACTAAPFVAAQSAPKEQRDSVEPDELVVGIDAVTYESSGSEDRVLAYTDGSGVVDLFSDLFGETAPTQADELTGSTLFDWGQIAVTMQSDGSARLNIGASSLDGVSIVVEGDVTVGAAVSDVLAAGAVTNEADSTELMMYVRDVAGTVSLADPSKVGVEYVLLMTDGSQVTRVLAPASDFGDL